MDAFIQRAQGVLRACLGGPEPGRPFLIVFILAMFAFVVTLEHVGLIVGMRRFSGLRAWVTGLVSYSVLLAAGSLAQHVAQISGWKAEHAQLAGICAAVVAALLIAVPFLSFSISVSYIGGVCALGLGVISSLILGKVATESMRSYREASARGKQIHVVEPKGLQHLLLD